MSLQVGITPDFRTRAAGLLEPALAEVLGPASHVNYDWMPDTAGVGVAEVLDRYDAVIGLDYQFPAESFRGIRRLAALARWGVGYDMVDVEACTLADVILTITPDSVRRRRECNAGRWCSSRGRCTVGLSVEFCVK